MKSVHDQTLRRGVMSLVQYILVTGLSLGLVACGGGGGGNSGSPAPEPNNPAPTPEPVVLTLELGQPSTNPIVAPPSPFDTQVKFFSVVSGNALPPEEIFLDELDIDGKVVATDIARLRDDGENVDSNLGDRIYSGSLLISSVESTEKYYRVRAELDGKTLTSGQMNFWVSGCPVRARPSDINAAVFDPLSDSLIFSNEVTMTVKEGVAPDLSVMNKIAADVNGRVVGCIPALREYLIEMHGDGTASGVYDAIDTLEANASVEKAYINTRITGLPADTGNPCAGEGCQWYLDRIRAPDAWLLAGGGDEEFSVAVIDFGVDCNHKELNCDASVHNKDWLDHGTGVASLISAGANDGTEVVGVAWNTEIFPQNFLGNGGSQYKMNELINASISDERAKVINISAGAAIDPNGKILESVCTAIGSGRLVVAAAGNAAQSRQCKLDNVYPAKYNGVGSCANGANLQAGLLVVGGTDINNSLAEWTDAGVGVCSNTMYVDIFAPGKDVFTASSVQGYSTKNGTSYAAPLVSGAAAVLWSASPELTVSQVHDLLLGSGASLASHSDNSRSISSDSRVQGTPLLDVYRAVGGQDIVPTEGGTPRLPDVQPDIFKFADKVDQPLAVAVTSDPITIAGIEQAAPIDVVGGHYSIDNGPFTSAAGSVKAAQQVRVRLTAASTPGVRRDLVLTVGGVSDTYSVTTGNLPVTLDNFSFVPQTNLALSQVAVSNEIVIGRIADNTPISIDVGEYSINGAAFTRDAGVINSGDALTVRLTSPSGYSSFAESVISIGGAKGRFRVTTVPLDSTPDVFSFVSKDNVSLNSEYVSNNITVSGINAEAFISISGGEYAIDGGAYTADAGSIRNGQTVNIRLRSADAEQTSTFSTLTIGGVSDTYHLTTLALDTTPDVFAFASQTDQALNTWVVSNSQVIGGINVAAVISIVGGEYAIDGGSFTSAEGMVSAGQSVQLRVQSSADFATTTAAELTVGSVKEVFNVTTFAADTVPDSFVFEDQTNIALNTEVTSNSIIVSGLNTSAPVSIEGGTYSINGGAYTTAAGVVGNGDIVTVRITSAATVATTVQTTLTIGGISDTFSVSTEGARLPAPFSFVDQTDVPRSSQVLSNILTITGLNTAVSISISGGEYSIDGGGFTNAPGVIANGQTVQVRLQTSAEFATASNAILTISGISDTFTAMTVAEDTTPDVFGFDPQTNAALDAQIESNTISISGINSTVSISIVGGEYRINGGVYTSAPESINNGDTVQVRLVASSAPATTSAATVTIGGVSGTFSVTTIPEDTTPDAFSFTDQTGAPRDTQITSNEITVAGVNTGTSVSVTGGEYSVNGGMFTNLAGVVFDGDLVAVRLVSSANFSTAVTATLTIGGVSAGFTATTLDADRTPDLFSFSDQINVRWNSLIESNTVTIGGIDDGTTVSITSGEYALDGGVFTAVDGVINSGQTLTVRVLSAGTELTDSTATVTVGTAVESFAVKTAPAESVVPTADILFPPAVSLTERDTVLVRGKASDASGIASVNVNGVEAVSSDGFATWTATVPLARGSNTVTATIADTQNNISTKTVDVRRGPLADDLRNLVIDHVNNRYLAIDNNELISIDRSTGAAQVISGSGIPNNDNLLEGVKDMELSGDASRVLVIDSPGNLDAVKEIDLATGTRTLISQDSLEEPAGTYHQIYDLAVDVPGNRIFVGDSQGLIEINLSTGVRRNLYDTTSIRGLVWDSVNNRVILALHSSIVAFNLQNLTTVTLSSNFMAGSTSTTSFDGIYGIAYDSATNTAYTSGRGDTKTVIKVNLDDGSRTLISDNTIATDTSEIDFNTNSSKYIALDKSNNRLYITDQNGVIAVDMTSGTRSWLLSGIGNTVGINFDAATNTLLVLSRAGPLYSFVLGDAAPTIISDNTIAVLDSNVSFSSAWALGVDLDSNLAYVGDWTTELVFSVDLGSGRRTIVSDNSVPDSENTFISPAAMLWREAESRALILDSGRRSIISLDTSTGSRAVISSTGVPDYANLLKQPADMTLDPNSGQAIILDKTYPGILSVDINTGSRSIYGSIPNDYKVGHMRGLTFNHSDNSVLISSSLYGVSRLNADFSYESSLLNTHIARIPQVLYDGSASNVIVLDQEASVAGTVEISDLDLTTGILTPQSIASTPGGGVILDEPADIAIHTATNSAYVVDQDQTVVIRVDLETGARTIFAGNDIAQASSNYSFVAIRGIGVDTANNRLLVGDISQNALIAVDLATAQRTLITDDSVAMATSNVSVQPRYIEVDDAGEFAYMTDWSVDGVIRVNLGTGERTLLSDNTIAVDSSNIAFSSNPVDIALDAPNNRVLVTDQGKSAVIAVDLASGVRTEFISRNTPLEGGGSTTIIPYYVTINRSTNQLIVVDNFLNDIYTANLDDGVRRNINAPTAMLMRTFGLRGAVYDPIHDTVLLLESYRDAVISVDIQTGDRVVLSQ